LDRDMGDTDALAPLLVPIDADQIQEHAVSTLVNSVRNNLAENILPLPPPPTRMGD